MAVDSGSGDLTTTNSGSVAPTSCEARRPGKAKTRKKKHANGSATPAAESASCATWNAYADAYRHRYGQEPVRNARINGQLAQFVARVPQADAPHLAAWYCSHNGRWYCQKGHPIGALLADAESLHTQWRQGHMLTEAAARETDGLQKRGQQWQEFIEEGRRLDALAAAAGETNTPGGDDHGHH